MDYYRSSSYTIIKGTNSMNLKKLVLSSITFILLNIVLYFYKAHDIAYLIISILGGIAILFTSSKTSSTILDSKPLDNTSQKTEKSGIDERINEELLSAAETIGFNVQQLLWVADKNASIFNKSYDISHKVESYSQQNAASAEEINASINEFVSFSRDLNKNVEEIEDYSAKSVDMLEKNRSVIEGISCFLGELTYEVGNASKSNEELMESSNR